MSSHTTPTPPITNNAYDDKEFMWYDYFIFIVTLVIALGIGIWSAMSGDRQRSTHSYLRGNRALQTLPVTMSIFMSFISAILVLGNTAEMYLHGIQQWLAMFCGAFIFLFTGLVFVPLFFPLNITSSFEYFEMRFKSKAVKLTGASIYILSQVMYMGIAMYSPATALASVTPIPTWVSILATGIVGTIYTSIGGMKAVVWTDVFQCLVLIGGLIAVMVVGIIKVGGFMNVFAIASETGRTTISFSFDPTVRLTFWSIMCGWTFSFMHLIGTGQTSVQRYCALPTKKKASLSVWLNIPFLLVVWSITCFAGLIVFAYYWELGCDPLRSGEISNANQLLPYFIVDVLKAPGLPGLFVAVLFSGALSSVSSSINSLSAVTWKDILEWKFYHLLEWKKTLITKLLSAVFGCLAILFAFFVAIIPGNVLQISIGFNTGVAAPLLGMFILGSWFPWSNKWGALIGGWFGLVLSVTGILGNSFAQAHKSYLNTSVDNCSNDTEITPIPMDPEDTLVLFSLSYMWYPLIGTLTTVIMGLIVSFITGPDKPSDLDPLVISNLSDNILCCLPRQFFRRLWCGIPFDEIELNEDGHALKFMDEKQDREQENNLELLRNDKQSDESSSFDVGIRRHNSVEKCTRNSVL